MSQSLTDGTTSTYENSLSVGAEPRDLDGTYTCRVSNTIGAAERSITINGEHGARKTAMCSYKYVYVHFTTV